MATWQGHPIGSVWCDECKRPSSCYRRFARRAGFTLLEMLVVLFVLTLAVGIAIPSFGGSLARYRAQCAAFELSSFIQSAGEQARYEGASVEIEVSIAGQSVIRKATTRTAMQTHLVRRSDRPTSLMSVSFVGTEGLSVDTLVYDHEGVPHVGELDGASPREPLESGVLRLASGSHSVELHVHPLTGDVEISP